MCVPIPLKCQLRTIWVPVKTKMAYDFSYSLSPIVCSSFIFLAHLIHLQMCLCYQKLEIGKFQEQIGSGSALIGSETSHDWEWIGSGSPPTHVISLSQSEAQKVRVDPLLDPLPRGSPSKKSCDLSKPIRE